MRIVKYTKIMFVWPLLDISSNCAYSNHIVFYNKKINVFKEKIFKNLQKLHANKYNHTFYFDQNRNKL